jgi:hypothetical protein
MGNYSDMKNEIMSFAGRMDGSGDHQVKRKKCTPRETNTMCFLSYNKSRYRKTKGT